MLSPSELLLLGFGIFIFLYFLTHRFPVGESVGLYDRVSHPKIELTLDRCVQVRNILGICTALVKFSACVQSELLKHVSTEVSLSLRWVQ